MLWIASLLLLQPVDADPRIALVELQAQGRYEEALAATERELAERPEQARPLGLDYLRGDLLERLDDPRQAKEAFARAMAARPDLAPYSRYRIAVLEERMGHPEVAAGLVATVLGRNAPAALIPDATTLLERSVRAGGDCRLLAELSRWTLPQPERRRLQLVQADCRVRAGNDAAAAAVLSELLREGTEDAVARSAAQRLLSRPRALDGNRILAMRVGMTFHFHREFDRSTLFLEQGLEALPQAPAMTAEEEFEARYSLARSYFWRRHYRTAASAFGELARVAPDGERRANCLFQQGRSQELEGDWGVAAHTFHQAYAAEPSGSLADAALLSALRVEWRGGREGEAVALFEQLAGRRQWRDLAQRGLLFLLSSDLVRGRAERAPAWLARFPEPAEEGRLEVVYWRGRLAELQGDADAALRHYLAVLRSDPYHPFARAARGRLKRGDLAVRARALGRSLAASDVSGDLWGAWVLLAGEGPVAASARRALEERLAAQPRARAFLRLEPVPPEDWPLWRAPAREPGELLLGLGLWDAGESYVGRHFPPSDPALAFTGGLRLAEVGLTRSALRVAEILLRRVPRELPEALLPAAYRRLLYPLPYRALIREEAEARGVDPCLIAAIIREESRFDPDAVSSASARGLTQFILPTAQRLAGQLGLSRLEPEDLHQPDAAISLGAAYLAELGLRYGGRPGQMVAAYNAGEDQADLWQAYCYSREPEEFLSKVGFTQTRAYLEKVLGSREQYRELYAELGTE